MAQESNNYTWIATLLSTLVSSGRKGKILEIRIEEGKIIASVLLESLSPREWEKVKKSLDLSSFFGQIVFNYAKGSHTVKTILSLTEEDYKKNPTLGL